MPPLRVFCIASTISPSFLRRKGAIIILLSLHQSNGQQPLFQILECWCHLLHFFLFLLILFWSVKQMFLCVSFLFLFLALSGHDPFLHLLSLWVVCKSCVIYLSNAHWVMRVWFARCVFLELWYSFLLHFLLDAIL